jgi:hypothetical protein
LKTKTTLLISTIIILALLVPSFTYFSHADQTPSLSLSPSFISGASMSVGSTFTVNIQISGVSNLWAWGASLYWDPTVLSMQGAPAEGAFMKSAGPTLYVPVPPNNTKGCVTGIGDAITSAVGASGSGILATVTFSVVSLGVSQITLNGTECDGLPQPITANPPIIPTTVTGATFTTSSTAPTPTPNTSTHGPTASFSPADGSTFPLNSAVLLNASSSQPGLDKTPINITSYFWSIEYPNGTTLTSLTGETATFNANVEGTFRIVLIVTANDTQSSPDPIYTNVDSTSALINVIGNPNLVNIDVFTDQGGVGPGVSGGSYGPLQLMQLYASVTYKGASLPLEPVVFAVQNTNGTVITVMQAPTNQTGIASTSFRLPAPDPTAPQNNFGNWSVIAAVNITGASASDTAKFTFAYQNGIQNVALPPSIQKGTVMQIQLTINSQHVSLQWNTLSISLFDQSGIPIGSTTIATSQLTQNLTVVDASMLIPNWAFPGNATAVFCILGNSANALSVPVAPEKTATFQIEP